MSASELSGIITGVISYDQELRWAKKLYLQIWQHKGQHTCLCELSVVMTDEKGNCVTGINTSGGAGLTSET